MTETTNRSGSIHRKLVTFLAVAVAALSAAPLSSSSQATMVSGTIVDGPNADEVRQFADGNIVIHHVHTVTFLGGLSGTFSHEGAAVLHPDFTLTFTESGTFDGTVDGTSGTIGLLIQGRGVFPSVQGHFTFLSGTDGFSNLHGGGTFEFTIGVGGTYLGQIHLDP